MSVAREACSVLFTIVVPVHNAGPFLDQCISSVIAQTQENWELLLIDDGSTDDSLGVCLRYAEADSRIRVISQENLGVSRARNAGLTQVRSEFLSFLDADDWLSPDYLAQIAQSLSRSGADIVLSGYRLQASDSADIVFRPSSDLEGSTQVAVKRVFMDLAKGSLQGYSCAFHYRTTALHGQLFDTSIPFSEDLDFIMRALRTAKTIAVAETSGYNYRIGHESASNSPRHLVRNAVASAIVSWHIVNYSRSLPFQASDRRMIARIRLHKLRRLVMAAIGRGQMTFDMKRSLAVELESTPEFHRLKNAGNQNVLDRQIDSYVLEDSSLRSWLVLRPLAMMGILMKRVQHTLRVPHQSRG